MVPSISRLRKLVGVIVIVWPVASPAWAGQSAGPNQTTAYDFYLSGNALCRNGQYDRAIAAFRKSLELNGKCHYTRVNLGVALAKSGQFDNALREFTFCVDNKWGGDPDRFVFHFNRVLALKAAGRMDAALDDRAALRELDSVRAEKLADSDEYILMDLAYMEQRNKADMSRLFQRERAAIISGEVVINRVADLGVNEQEHEVIGIIEGTVEQVAGVLTDYKNYPEFMPNVKEITIRNSDDGGTVVDHKLVFTMGFVKKYRLQFRSKNEENRRQIFWKKLPWPGVKDKETVVDTYGQWILENLPGSDNKALAYYRVYTDTGSVPFGIGWLVEPLTKKSFQDMFEGTRKRVAELYD